jgi:DNA-binding IclR family transcriptional regulator
MDDPHYETLGAARLEVKVLCDPLSAAVAIGKLARMARPAERTSSPNGIQVIERAADVLRTLYGEPRGLSLAQIAERVALPRSTVQRLVAALVRERLLATASPTGRVRLGPELTRLANSRRELSEDVRPFMTRLLREFDETVVCSIIDGDMQRCVEQIAVPHRLRTEFPVGATMSLYNTANGKALLAQLEDEEVVDLLPARLKRETGNTITSRAVLRKELAKIRDGGVAFDHEERTVGIAAAAIATKDHFGVPFAICVAVPTQRFYGREDDIAAALDSIRRALEAEIRG